MIGFDLISFPRHPIILGFSWLMTHNPIVDLCRQYLNFTTRMGKDNMNLKVFRVIGASAHLGQARGYPRSSNFNFSPLKIFGRVTNLVHQEKGWLPTPMCRLPRTRLKKSSTPSFYVENSIFWYIGKDTRYLKLLGNLTTIWWMQLRQFVISIFVIHTRSHYLNTGDNVTRMTTIMSRFELVTSCVIIECYVLTNMSNMHNCS